MRRPLYGWLTASAISLTGTRVSMIALPLFALETTGSATLTGLVALAESLPLVVLKVLGGPVIDRLGTRRVALTCDVVSVAVVGAIPLLADAGLLSFGLLLVLVAIAGALRGPSDTAREAMTPALVAEARVPLERATGLDATVERTAGMVGAALGGLLVAAVGSTNALLIDAASFGLAAMVLAWATRGLATVGPPSSPPVEGAAASPSYAEALREGWRFLRGERVLLAIGVMVAVTNLLDAAWSTVLVPVWAVTSGGGAAAVGLLFAVFSGASVLGSVTASAWSARLPRFRVYLVCFALAGLPRFVALALDVPIAVVLAVAVISGYAAGFINPVLGAVLFERVPAHLVGRVNALINAMSSSLLPFGGLVGGALIAGIGVSPALMVVGVVYFTATTLPAVDRRFRDLDRRPVEPSLRAGAPG